MSEKRFKKMDTIIDPFPIWDTVEEKGYNCTDTLDVLVDLLNELSDENNILNTNEDDLKECTIENIKLKEENEQLQKDLYIVQTDCKNAKESKEHWRNKAKELEEKNKQIGFLKRDLYTIIRDTKETPFGNSITMTQIRERWE